MAEFISSVLWVAVEVLLVYTGKAVIWGISAGRWRSESLNGDEGRVYGAAGALSFIPDGQRVITPNGLLFAGLALYVLLVFSVFFYASRV